MKHLPRACTRVSRRLFRCVFCSNTSFGRVRVRQGSTRSRKYNCETVGGSQDSRHHKEGSFRIGDDNCNMTRDSRCMHVPRAVWRVGCACGERAQAHALPTGAAQSHSRHRRSEYKVSDLRALHAARAAVNQPSSWLQEGTGLGHYACDADDCLGSLHGSLQRCEQQSGDGGGGGGCGHAGPSRR